ncbi:hypothetical protein ABID46_001009 [Moheibacter stercoris]|uniref:Lipoprotein n=1 Tax=Moheibacter stercoris TaxID=1628251 RepID=A0ABV2LS90_9FLAO
MRFSCFLVLLLFLSCSKSKKFNSDLWMQYESGVHEKNRIRMLDDFVLNHLKP